jgi:hypothetical protein
MIIFIWKKMKVCRAGPSGHVTHCLSGRDRRALSLNELGHLSHFICLAPPGRGRPAPFDSSTCKPWKTVIEDVFCSNIIEDQVEEPPKGLMERRKFGPTVYLLERRSTQSSLKDCISTQTFLTPKPPHYLGRENLCHPTKWIPLLSESQDEIVSGLINVVTDALRKPNNLQVVGRDWGEDRWS